MREGMRRGLMRACWAVLLGSAGALVGVRIGRPLYYTDGSAAVLGAGLADASMLRFGSPAPVCELPGPVVGRVAQLPDGRLLYGRGKDGGDVDLVLFDPQRPGLEPEPAYGLNTAAHELAPAVLADGTVCFASDRDGGAGGYDLYRSRYRAGRFAPAEPLLPCNTAKDETDPAPAADGDTLVYARIDPLLRDGHNGVLYLARLASGQEPQPVFADEAARRFDLRAEDRDPALSPDGHVLWFVRRTAGGPARVLCSVRLGGAFDVPLGQDQGFGGRELRSPLPAGDGLSLGLLQPGQPALWYRSAGEPLHPWWAGQRALERWLLAALLAAAVLLLLLHLGRRWRTLDLVTQCLLLSLLLHLLLMLWLMGVEIAGSVLPGDDEASGIEVTLLHEDAAGSTASADGPRSEDLAASIAFQPKVRSLSAAAPAAAVAAAARASTEELAGEAAFAHEAMAQAVDTAAPSLLDAAAELPLRAAAAAAERTAPASLPSVTPQPLLAAAQHDEVPAAAKFEVGVPQARVEAAVRQSLEGAVDVAAATPAASARDLAVAATRVQDAAVVTPTRQAEDAPAALRASAVAVAAMATPKTGAASALQRPATAADTATTAAVPALELAAAARDAELAPTATAAAVPLASAMLAAPSTSPRDAVARVEPRPAVTAGAGAESAPQPLAAPAAPRAEAATFAPDRVATAMPAVAASAAPSPSPAVLPRSGAAVEAPAAALAEALPRATARSLLPTSPLRDAPPGAAVATAGEARPTPASAAVGTASLQPMATPDQAAARADTPALARDSTATAPPPSQPLASPASSLATVDRRDVAVAAAAPRAAPTMRQAAPAVRLQLRDGASRPAAAPSSAPRVASSGGAELSPLRAEATAPRAGDLPGPRRPAAASPAGALPPQPGSDLARAAGDPAAPVAALPPSPSAPLAAPGPARLRDRGTLAAAAAPRPASGPNADVVRPLPALVADLRANSRRAAPQRRPQPGLAAAELSAPLPGSLLQRAPAAAPQLPVASAPAAANGAYSNRFGPARQQALEQYGGTAVTERAVAMGLRYLASIQHADGSWGARDHFDEKYGHVYIGKTALCLLAFLGAGHSPQSRSEYSGVVQSAVRHLLSVQDPDTGAFGQSSAYGHGISTYALAECYGLTKDPALLRPVEEGLSWILQHQGPRRDRKNQGGWGYFSPGLRAEDDYARVSVSAWMIMALESARLSGIELPDDALPQARRFLELAFDADHGWFRYNHKPSRLNSAWPTLPASTPAGAFGLMLLGEDKDSERVAAAVDFTVERRPEQYRRYSDDDFVLRAQGNVYFWYYGSLACFLRGGEAWKRWNERLSTVLPRGQDEDGSFPPIDVYARYAGDTNQDRAYTTAMCVLSLEIYYRYFTPLLVGR